MPNRRGLSAARGAFLRRYRSAEESDRQRQRAAGPLPNLRAHLLMLPVVTRTHDCIQNIGGQRMDTAQPHDSSRWWVRWGLRRHSSQDEAQVARWKAAWLRGATAIWQHPNESTNPYDSEMQRAAWNAGAKWAGENPNRRTNNAGRFAHPRRRASDTKLPYMVKRAVAVGATTLTLYAISRTLWRAKTTPEDES
jgi:hypothetical protein